MNSGSFMITENDLAPTSDVQKTRKGPAGVLAVPKRDINCILHLHYSHIYIYITLVSCTYNRENINVSEYKSFKLCYNRRFTIRKIADSIHDGVIGIFYRLDLSGRTVALWSTQSLAEMSTKGYPLRGKGGQCLGLTTLPPWFADSLEILGALTPCSPNGLYG